MHGVTLVRVLAGAIGRPCYCDPELMRILFVSGTSVGGAAKSTAELAAALARRGHRVATLMALDEARRTRAWNDRLLDASVRLRPLEKTIDPIRRRVGARLCELSEANGVVSARAAKPANALAAMIQRVRPDVVVTNSVERPEWRQIHDDLGKLGIPRVLYLRERTSLGHLTRLGLPGDLLLSNASGHAAEAAAAGYRATVIPSIVETDAARVESSRERVVYVNPVPLFGLDIALGLASDRPDIPFTFVKSWPLEESESAALDAAIAALGNVEIQEFSASVADVYRRARVVLLPYRHPGRPRVVVEAHANGIPVLASREDGLAEGVGPGGSCVDVDASRDEWARALGALWDDVEHYDEVVARTRAFAARPDIQPSVVVDTFEVALRDRFGLT